MTESDVERFLSKSNYRHVKNYRKKIKERLVDYKGGKCEICGYNKCIEALEFHHLNPKEKDFTLSSSNVLSFDKMKEEADKCILVCANCHREIHHKENEEKMELESKEEERALSEIMRNRGEYCIKHVKNSYKYLESAGILNDMAANMKRCDIFKKYHINNKTFNKFLEYHGITYHSKKTIENKPSKSELLELLSKNSKSSIGRMFGVSCSAVIKWCKKYEIQ